MKELSDNEVRIRFIKSELSGLLLDKPLFARILRDVIEGSGYPDIRQGTMFDNEIPLYSDINRLFSARLYLWAPGEYTPIHDHNSWGVIGPGLGRYEVIKYRREKEGPQEAWGGLVEVERLILLPGQTEVTLPLNEGIHQTGNPSDQTIFTLHVYGNPIRRAYINGFDMDKGRVYRIYAPKVKKRMLASQALASLEG
ncbi:MAG: cysteine dioxygenase family protein [Pseudomonadota bacterium]